MDDKERQEWSRHYDIIQWAIITIFTAGVGALLALSLSVEHRQERWWPEIAGIVLTLVGLLWVAGFRRFRRRLHEAIEDKELKESLRRPAGFPSQWTVFVVVFSVVDAALVTQLEVKVGYPCAMFSFGLFLAVILFGIWHVGK